MKYSNNDNYDLNSSSPEGQPGFEPFKTKKHYYFHFNDTNGDCILFSQAYTSKSGADNGMASVKKNVQIKDHVLLHHNDDLHYFTIKAGNNQEVARSRNFESIAEMETALHFLYEHLGYTYESRISEEMPQKEINTLKAEKEALEMQLQEKLTVEKELSERIWEVETALGETTNALNENLLKQDEWAKEKAGLEKKLVLLTKKLSNLDLSQPTQTEETSLEDFQVSNFGFKVNFYNVDNADDVKVAVYNPLSKENKVIVGFDQEAIFDFMVSKLPSTVLPKKNKPKKIRAEQTTARGIITPSSMDQETEPNRVTDTLSIPETLAEKVTEEINTVASTPIRMTKKVKTIYQMKAFVETIKREEPLIPSKKESIQVPVEKITKPEEISTEDIKVLEKFFGDGTTPSINEAKVKSPEPIFEEMEDISIEKEDNTLRHFFKEQEKIKVDTVVQERHIPEPINDTEEATKTVQKFFPQNSEKEQVYIKEDLPKKVETVSKEIIENTTAEKNTIKKFFPVKNVEKEATVALNKIPNPYPICELYKDDGKDQISHFFGTYKPIEKQSKGVNLEHEIIESILNTMAVEAESEPEDEQSIQKFFGKSKKIGLEKNADIEVKQPKVQESFPLSFNNQVTENTAEATAVQRFFTIEKSIEKTPEKEVVFNKKGGKRKDEEIALFNKWFGKQVK